MIIFLIGYMGSGKSTIGHRLAKQLNLQFIDLDIFIEETNFTSIPDIFAKEGEDVFREKEHKALKEVAQFENIVVATGGGAPCFFNNMKIMNQSGTCIYLDVPPATLANRLMNSKTERPLIKGKSKTELEAFLSQTLQQRNPYYRQAKIIIEVKEDETVDELVLNIKSRVNKNK